MSDQETHIRQIVSWAVVGLIAVIAVSIVLSFYFGPRLQGPFSPFSFGWLGGIFLIFMIFWIARLLIWPRRGGYYNQHGIAKIILKERYAKGEITKEQFDQMMSDSERKT